MIKNDLQYRVKKAALKRFRETLKEHKRMAGDQEPWVRKLHRSTIAGEIRQLESEIEKYEQLKSGHYTGPPLDIVEQIPDMLIKRRIALGWTQEDLARRLGVKPQQVQADEATNYASANLARLMRTAAILKSARIKQAGARKKASTPANQTASRRVSG